MTSAGVRSSIRAQADSDANRIKQFADRLAQNIKSQGDLEAVQYLSRMKDNPELAVFNSAMDFIRDVYAKRMTMVVSGSMPGIWMLFPDATEHMKTSQIPPLTRPEAAEAPKAEKAAEDEAGTKVSTEGRR